MAAAFGKFIPKPISPMIVVENIGTNVEIAERPLVSRVQQFIRNKAQAFIRRIKKYCGLSIISVVFADDGGAKCGNGATSTISVIEAGSEVLENMIPAPVTALSKQNPLSKRSDVIVKNVQASRLLSDRDQKIMTTVQKSLAEHPVDQHDVLGVEKRIDEIAQSLDMNEDEVAKLITRRHTLE